MLSIYLFFPRGLVTSLEKKSSMDYPHPISHIHDPHPNRDTRNKLYPCEVWLLKRHWMKRKRVEDQEGEGEEEEVVPKRRRIVHSWDPHVHTMEIPDSISLDSATSCPTDFPGPEEIPPLIFQQMEVETHVHNIDDFPSHLQSYLLAEDGCDLPVIYYYGVTKDGQSVLCRAWGYKPYFYTEIPYGMDCSPKAIERFRLFLIATLHSDWRSKRTCANVADVIERIDVVSRTSLMSYKKTPSSFLKITTELPAHVPLIRGILEKGIMIDGIGMTSIMTYESNVLFTMRCMIDADIAGCSWIECPPRTYVVSEEKKSSCAIEVDCLASAIVSHLPNSDKRWAAIAPLRILSYDIECLGYLTPGATKGKPHFPKANLDECSVIQIANVLTVQGEDAPRAKNVFVLNGCADIPGAKVYSFHSERDLLLAWAAYIITVDPDVITGYNIVNFDFPYLLDRARHLGIPEFNFLGRLRGVPTFYRKTHFASKQMGARETMDIHIPGRLILDVIDVVRREHKLSSYTLNNVSSIFLKEQKDDVHYSIMNDLHRKDAEGRKRLAVYCIKDALLPQRLIDTLKIMFNWVEMARVTGLPISMLLSRGQQIKVVSQLLREARKSGLVMPHLAHSDSAEEDGVKYKGATVLKPKTGYYKDEPISTLDFASLYPSIMIAHNLCYTTMISPEDAAQMNPEDYTITTTGSMFVKVHVRQGLLPRILRHLLDARAAARDALRNTTDATLKAVLDGRQLALKVSANSVYGFTGASTGQLPCLEISTSVTGFGRQMIEKTKNWVEEHYSKKNGYAWDSEVIYGDTDSVMIKFGTTDLAEAIRLGKEAGPLITKALFIPPIRLEFEKTYHPYLLLKKKRYAGLWYSNPNKFDKLDTKGLEIVRRDNCSLVRDLLKQCLNCVLIHKNIPMALELAKKTISLLLTNQLDMSVLVITKTLSKLEYKAKQPHAELAKKMAIRDPATAPVQGDRVKYVYVCKGSKAKECDMAEDPEYVLKHEIPINADYYLKNKLEPSLRRLLEMVITLQQMHELFNGKHTRHVVLAAPKSTGIMKFAKKSNVCSGCKRRIPTSKALCQDCEENKAEVYEKIMQKRNHFEALSQRCWVQCLRCQKSLAQEVVCKNDDCPLYYRRDQAKLLLQQSQEELDRFSALAW